MSGVLLGTYKRIFNNLDIIIIIIIIIITSSFYIFSYNDMPEDGLSTGRKM